MIIIEQSAQISPLLTDLGYILKGDAIYSSTEADLGQQRLLLVEAELLSTLSQEQQDQCLGLIVFGETSDIPGSLIHHFPSTQLNSLEKVQLRNTIDRLLQLRDEKDKERFISSQLYERLLNIEASSIAQSQNLKKINRALVPKRFANLKGIDIAARYLSGHRVGSEYYDVHFKGSQGLILMLSSTSYLLSTVAISLFSDIKAQNESILQSYTQYLHSLRDEIANFPDGELSFCLLKIDSRALKMSGVNFGEQIIGSKEGMLKGAPLEMFQQGDLKENFQLKIGLNQLLIIGSRGLSRQIEMSLGEEGLKELISNSDDSPANLADEILLSLKADDKGRLEWDASILVMEATKNALYSL